MSLGVVGVKRGMTRVFSEDGASTPVTVLEVVANRVIRVKTEKSDGYRAVQVTYGEKHKNRVNKALEGEYKKAGELAGLGLWEFRLDEGEGQDLTAGSEIPLGLFEEGQIVDVSGTSIGKGFAGTIKRHNFKGQDATHGNSLSHRVPGSIGQCQTPGRVFKGKKMAGQMGNKQCTVQGLEVVRVDAENRYLLVKGAVPGAKGGALLIHHGIKNRKVSD